MEYTCEITQPMDVLALIARDPGELVFVIDSEGYEEYLATYDTLKEFGEENPTVVYNPKEFHQIKNYFKGVKRYYENRNK